MRTPCQGTPSVACILSAALAMLAPFPMGAQAVGATVSGVVTHESGAGLAGVAVELRSSTTGSPLQSTLTDASGMFSVTELDGGTYDLTFVLPGFRPVERPGIEVRPGATVDLRVELSLQVDEQVVVVGSRSKPRSVTESSVPIDAIPFRDVANQGTTSLDYQLRTLVPSFNVATHPTSGAATLVRPATLRNLAHDHLLVLMNGKRRHRSAILVWFGGQTDGTQGPDLSTIPAIALRQVEVLRDGASAQYGSDAIAGVINFLLKDDREGGSLEFRTGTYRQGDGDSYTAAGNVGLPVGETGFANLSFEYGNADRTSRSVQRADAAALIAAGNTAVLDPVQPWGNPAIDDDVKLLGNFGHLFRNGMQAYGHTNFAKKTSTQGFYFRNPNTRANIFSVDGGKSLLIGDVLDAQDGILDGSANCPSVPIENHRPDPTALDQVLADPNCFSFQEIARGGFTPYFSGVMSEKSAVVGVRRALASGLTWDGSASYGSHEADFFLYNSVNASLGPDSPRDFDPGLYRQEEFSFNGDLSYALSGMVHLAGGAEWRNERFTIREGGRASWEVGPYAPQGFVAGSNGYAGFPDYAAGTWNRSNIALYGDVEMRDPTDRWTIGGAVRFEHFDIFGSTTNGKLSGRYALTNAVAIRGGVSSGFRAPTPGQQNTFNVQTTINPETLDLVESATVPSTFRAAQLRGGMALDPETSFNRTLGLVVDTKGFTVTADYYRVDVSNRLAVSRFFTLADDERALLLSEGITTARNLAFFRFFVNDFNTRTRGLDLNATWTPADLGGDTALSFAMNYTDTSVSKQSEHHGPGDVLALERGVPRFRWNAAVNQRLGRVQLLGRLHYYGSWVDHLDARSIRGADAPVLGGRHIVDLEAGIPLAHNVTLSIGGQNIFNTFSDSVPLFAENFGLPHSQYTPWGFSGGYYYVRVSYSWSQ